MNKPNSSPHSLLSRALVFALPLLFVSGSVSGVTLLSDSFGIPAGAATVGDDPTDATDTAWTDVNVNSTGGSNFSHSVVNDTTLGSNAMRITSNDRGHPLSGNLLSGATLTNVGDKITLSMDFRQSVQAAGGFRFGLFNSDGDGYWANLGTPAGAGAGGSNVQKTNDNSGELFTSFTNLLGTNVATGLDDSGSTIQDLFFEIELTDANTVSFTVSFSTSNTGSPTSFTATDSSGIFTDFTRVGLAYGADNSGSLLNYEFSVDNVLVDYAPIPEPSAAALLLGGLAFLLVLRRRR